MSFNKIIYKNNETIITADNLNDIQDAILEGYQPDGTIEYAAFAESTKLALLNLIYPIGSIYMSVNNISPANQFGGTWEQIKDRFILAAGNSYTAGTTGGEATHKLTVNEMPSHSHTINNVFGNVTESNAFAYNWGTEWKRPQSIITSTYSAGGGAAHNNMPPYLVAYMWKRIA